MKKALGKTPVPTSLAFLFTITVTSWSPSNHATEATGHPDFSGVWQPAGFEYVVRPDENNPKYTPEAQRNLEEYNQYYDPVADDPALFCVPKGMPWTMLSLARDYLVEIYQTPDRVAMFFEGSDMWRNIYIDQRVSTQGVPRSFNGVATAHWDGNTLVVETTNLTARHPLQPYQRSEEAKIIEHWTLEQVEGIGQALVVDVTYIDPLTFTEPARGRQVFKHSREGAIPGGYNCFDSLFDEYMDKRAEEIEAKKEASKVTTNEK